MGSEDFSLLRHVRALRRQLWLIALCVASGLAAASIVVATQSSVYRASMKILLGQDGGPFDPANAGAVDPFAQTMANLLSSDVVATDVIRDLRLKLSDQQLLSHLSVTTNPQSAVLDVSYDSSDPAAAVRILTDTGTVFTGLVSPQSADTASGGLVSATIFDPAHLDPGLVSPRPARTLGLAAALALLVGIVLALGRQALNPRLDSPDQAEEWFQAPVVGTLPRRCLSVSPLAVWFRPPPAADRVRAGLARLIAQLHAVAGGVIVVTCVDGNEGKSAFVAHLGAALASGGQHVVCVEVDDRPPTVISCLGLADAAGVCEQHGLLDVIGGRIELRDALRSVRLDAAQGNGRLVAGQTDGARDAGRTTTLPTRSGMPGASRLEFLPSGAPWSSAATAPVAAALGSLVRTLSSEGRYVIVDTPPVLLFPHLFGLARASDKLLMIAEKGSTTKADAETVRAMLEPEHADKLQIVLADPSSRHQPRSPSPLLWRRRLRPRHAEPTGLSDAPADEAVLPAQAATDA